MLISLFFGVGAALVMLGGGRLLLSTVRSQDTLKRAAFVWLLFMILIAPCAIMWVNNTAAVAYVSAMLVVGLSLALLRKP